MLPLAETLFDRKSYGFGRVSIFPKGELCPDVLSTYEWH